MQHLVDTIVRLYFDTHDLVSHQLDSYNTFLNVQLPQILLSFPVVKTEHAPSNTTHCFQFLDAYVDRPRTNGNTILLPQEAKLRNLMYEGNLYIKLQYSLYGGCSAKAGRRKTYESKKTEEEELNQVYDPDQDDQLTLLFREVYDQIVLCRIPIMVKSNKCHLSDCFGIFHPQQDNFLTDSTRTIVYPPPPVAPTATTSTIVKAAAITTAATTEKLHVKTSAFLAAESLKKEFIDKLYHGGFFIIKGQEKVVLIQERMRYMHPCVTAVPKSTRFVRYSHVSEIRSCHESKMKASSTLKMYLSKPSRDGGITCVHVDIPYLKSENMPLPWLFRLMGVDTAEEMESYLLDTPPSPNEQLSSKLQQTQKNYNQIIRKMCRDFSTSKYDTSKQNSSDNDLKDEQNSNENSNSWINIDVIYKFYEKVGPKQLHYLTQHEVLPHIGLDDSKSTRTLKLIYLGQQARELLLLAVKGISVDNREHMVHKRMESTGLLMALLFRQLVWPECKQIKTTFHKFLDKEHKRALKDGDDTGVIFQRDYYDKLKSQLTNSNSKNDLEFVKYCNNFVKTQRNIPALFLRLGISESLRYALATGNWGKNKGASNSQQGISQPLNRTSPMSTLSHLRRTSVPISKDGKLLDPRQLHTSQWGMLCPAETPEGKACGLIKNLALFSHVNSGIPYSKLRYIVHTCIAEELSLQPITSSNNTSNQKQDHVMIYINGTPSYWLPITREQPLNKSIKRLRELRQKGVIPYTTSIYLAKKFLSHVLHINCYSGSMIRPMINTEKLTRLATQCLRHLKNDGLENDSLENNDCADNFKIDPITLQHFCDAIQYFDDQSSDIDSDGISKTRVSWTRMSNMCPSHTARTLWNFLLHSGIIQYLDKNEEAEYQVAPSLSDLKLESSTTVSCSTNNNDNLSSTTTNVRTTNVTAANVTTTNVTAVNTTAANAITTFKFKQPFVEIVEWAIWGVMASFIVLLEHNQAVRNIFQCSHGKAAVGISSMGFQQAVHAIHHQLWYPQTPLVDTDSERLIGVAQLPSGSNAVVAVMLQSGDNPEDAIIVSKAALERGLFRSSLLHTYPYEENKNEKNLVFQKNPKTVLLDNINKALADIKNNSTTVRTKIDLDKRQKRLVNADQHIDTDGLAKPGYILKYNDKIFEQIDNVETPEKQSDIPIKSKSITYKGKGSHQHLAQAHSLKHIPEDDDGGIQARRKKLLNRDFGAVDFDSNEAASRIDKVTVTNTFQPMKPNYNHLTVDNNKDDLIDDADMDNEKDSRHSKSIFVRLHIMRPPQVGDKLSSRHGQKGVIARVVPPEDMPWTREGIIPDLIINTHYMPSRMTVAQTLEQLMSKQACLDGKIRNGTSFVNRLKDHHIKKNSTNDTRGANIPRIFVTQKQWLSIIKKRGMKDQDTLDFLQDIETSLHDSGYSSNGCEKLYRGDTGEAINACIFLGLVNYQRLTHQATDKIHARATGPKMAIIGQPTERRSKDGGQRVGEMEKDCLISYGAVLVTKDRLIDCSDFTPVCVCRKCGFIVTSASLGPVADRFALKNNRWTRYYRDIGIDLNIPNTNITDGQNRSSASISAKKLTFIEYPDQDRQTQLQKICSFQKRVDLITCRTCLDARPDDIRIVALPRALCCLLNEMMGMNICPKLILD